MEKGNRKFLKSDRCKTFQDLLEKEMSETNGPLESNKDLLVEHAATCPDCAAFSRALKIAGDTPPVSSEERDRLIESAWAGFQSRRRRAVLAGICAASAVLVLVFAFLMNYVGGEQPAFRLVKGRLMVDHAEAGPGHLLRAAEDVAVQSSLAVMESEELLTAAMDRTARMRVLKLDKTGMDLDLHFGTLAVHLKHTQRFGVSVGMPMGKVIATGTIFAVTIDHQDARVDVVEGTVQVLPRTEGEKAVSVKGGWSLYVRENIKSRLDEPTRKRILDMLAGIPEETEEAAEAYAGKNAPGGSVPGKTHEPGSEPGNRKGEIGKKESSKPAMDELFNLARSCRANKEWTCAADAYKRITAIYPKSQEAVTVLVSLAEIQLDNLKMPEEALENFETYLKKRPGGSLAKEALYGKIQALRALGRKNEEIESLTKFLELYPESLEAPKAEKRFKEIVGSGLP